MYVTRSERYRKYILKYLSNEKKEIIFLDTETTGLKKDSQIIEFAAKKCMVENGKCTIIDSIDVYIKPWFPISEEIEEITGITNEFLADKKGEAEVFKEISAFLGEYPVIAAYNAPFDVAKIESLYERNGKLLMPELTVDILQIARDCIPTEEAKSHEYKIRKATGKSSWHCLTASCITLGIDISKISFHNALEDVTATILCFEKLWERYVELEKKSTEKKPVLFYKGSSYSGFKGHNRIYLVTNLGVLYYDTYNSEFCSESFDVTEINIDSLIEQALKKYNVTSLSALFNLLEKEVKENAD